MENQVIHRDRQELKHTDLNNMQTWAHEAHQHLVKDAITTERQFTGLAVTSLSGTQIQIAPGRLYDGTTGNVYPLADATPASVFSLLPLTNEKWLAVSVYGSEDDTDIQPRDFLVDLQTLQTQPSDVAMKRRKFLNSHIQPGQESPTPERPEPPTGYTLIAHVRLNSSGIQEIVLATSRRLPNLQAMDARLQTTEGWIKAAEPRIAHIVSDIAGLGSELAQRSTLQQYRQLAMDMARLKERAEIPDDYKNYGADHFLTADESNPAAVGYSARLHEGIRPIFSGTATLSLSLLNPIDPAAHVGSDGFLLPAYTEVTRLQMDHQQGELTINQYQYQTTNMVQKSMARQNIVYGETRTYCTNSAFWASGIYDPASGILRFASGETWEVAVEDRGRAVINHEFVRLTQFWTTVSTQSYWENVTTTTTVQGSQLAQTILMAQTGWMTSVDVYFTSVDASGGLTVAVTDASTGQPDLNHAIAKLTLASNALSAGWCRLTFTRPVFVESGKRYAIVLISGAQHRVGFTDGTEYTQGVLMYAQDNAFFNEAAGRDLMMRLQFAKFNVPRAIIQFTPLTLTGGIGDINMLFEGITPNGTGLQYEYQVGGLWYPIADQTAENLATTPALLPFRAIFNGTTDLMPGMRLTNSQVIVSKVGTAFTHFSTTRTIGSSSTNIQVRLLLEDFDPAVHTVDCKIVVSGTPVTAASYVDEMVDARSRWREYHFTPSATSSYVIKITGSTTDWRQSFHVAERFDLAL